MHFAKTGDEGEGYERCLYHLVAIGSGHEMAITQLLGYAEKQKFGTATLTNFGHFKDDDKPNWRNRSCCDDRAGISLEKSRVTSIAAFLDGDATRHKEALVGLSCGTKLSMFRYGGWMQLKGAPGSGWLLYFLLIMMLLCVSCDRQTPGAKVDQHGALGTDAVGSRQDLLDAVPVVREFDGEDHQEFPEPEPEPGESAAFGGNFHELHEFERRVLEAGEKDRPDRHDAEPVVFEDGGRNHQELPGVEPVVPGVDGKDDALVGAWRKIVLGDDPADPVYRLAVFPRVPDAGTLFAVYDYDAGRVICCMRVDGGGLDLDHLLDDLNLPMSRALEVLNVLWRGEPGYSSRAVKLVAESDFAGHESEGWERSFGGETWNFSSERDGILVPEGSRLVAPRVLSIGGENYDVIWSPEWIGDHVGLMDKYVFRPQSGGEDRLVGVAHNHVN